MSPAAVANMGQNAPVDSSFRKLQERARANIAYLKRTHPNFKASVSSGIGPSEVRKRKASYNNLAFNFEALHNPQRHESLQKLLCGWLKEAKTPTGKGGPSISPNSSSDTISDRELSRRCITALKNAANMKDNEEGLVTFIDIETLKLWARTKSPDRKDLTSRANPLIDLRYLNLSPADMDLYKARFKEYIQQGCGESTGGSINDRVESTTEGLEVAGQPSSVPTARTDNPSVQDNISSRSRRRSSHLSLTTPDPEILSRPSKKRRRTSRRQRDMGHEDNDTHSISGSRQIIELIAAESAPASPMPFIIDQSALRPALEALWKVLALHANYPDLGGRLPLDHFNRLFSVPKSDVTALIRRVQDFESATEAKTAIIGAADLVESVKINESLL